MSLTVERVRTAAPEEWDAIWRDCDFATFFHSRPWAEAWSAASKGSLEPFPRLVSFSDGTRALLPLSRRRRLLGLVETQVSSPGWTYGGWLATDALTASHARLLSRLLTSEHRDLFWKINPFDPLAAGLELPASEPDETQVIDLEPGFDAIERSWTKGHRAAASQARRKGVGVFRAETAAHWRAYFDLYEDSLERWGKRTLMRHGWELFDELRRLDSPHVRLWMAEQGGDPIAGMLCLASRRHVVYWHGAARGTAFELRPVHLLVREAVRDACEPRDDVPRTWFDFNPSGPLEGVRAFKKGFGTRELACPNVRLQPGWRRAARRIHGSIGR